MKRIYRIDEKSFFGGVCAGIGEYLNVDVTIIRLILAMIMIYESGVFYFYLLAWFIIPDIEDIEGIEDKKNIEDKDNIENI